MGIIVADTYTRADSALTMGSPETGPGAYSPQTGTWGVLSNQGYCVTHADGDLTLLPAGQADQDSTVDVVTTTTALIGLLASASDASNAYLLQLQPSASELQLYTVIAGSFVKIGSSSTGATSATIRITSRTASQVCYLNGASVITTTDSGVTRGNNGGYRHGGTDTTARVDNLSVDNLVVGTIVDAGPPYVATPPGFLSPIGTMTRFPMMIGDSYVYPGVPVSLDGGHGDMAIAATTDGLIANMDLAGHGDIAIGGVTGDLILTADLRGHGDLSVAAVADLLLTADLAGHGDIAIASKGDLILTADLTGHADQAIAATGAVVATLDLTGHGDMAITAAADLMLQAALDGHADIAIAVFGDLTVTTSTTTTVVFVFRRLMLGSRRAVAPRSHGIRGPD